MAIKRDVLEGMARCSCQLGRPEQAQELTEKLVRSVTSEGYAVYLMVPFSNTFLSTAHCKRVLWGLRDGAELHATNSLFLKSA